MGFSAQSQISASQWMLGGGARLFATGFSGEYTANVEFSANAAYLIQFNSKEDKNNGTLALGLRPSFEWDPVSETYSGVGFARYYYNFERVSPFVEFNMGYSFRNVYSTSSGALAQYEESFVLGGKIGSAFYISNHVTFDTFLFYDSFDTVIHLQDSGVSGTNQQFAIGLGLGFQIFLQCKK